MGESSPCLVRSYSQPSPISQESNGGDPVQCALTTSVSFGRFMSESLAWEKWSSFSHNRYLEEVEKYSKPGSVAEKKAYFEAHYKKKAAEKAAAAIEQEIEATNDYLASSLGNEIGNDLLVDNEVVQEGSSVAMEEIRGEVAPSTDLVYERTDEIVQLEKTEEAKEEASFEEKQVGLSILLEDAQQTSNNHGVTAPVEDSTAVEVLTCSDGKKPILPSGKSSDGHNQVPRPRPSGKPTTAIQPKNSDRVTFQCKSAGISVDKKRSTPRSIHMSINFSSRTAETNKNLSPLLHKIVNSSVTRKFSKPSRESTNQQTPTRVAPTNGVLKHHSLTPRLENRRTKTQLDHSVFERLTQDRKPEFPYKHSKSSTTSGRKAQCPYMSSSFSLQSGERTGLRKEFFQKLEHQVKMDRAKAEHHLTAKLKEKTHNDSRDVGRTFASQAKANASLRLGTTSLDVPIKKVSTTQTCSSRIEKKIASEVLNNKSRPPWRLSMKTDNFRDVLGKNYKPTKVSQKKSMHENASPNIQL